MTEIRITVTNTSASGGTALTPFWFALHDGSFDLYDRNTAASPGLEALAEDGSFATINAEVAAVDADGQTGAVFGERGPIAAGETGSAVIDVDAASNARISLAAMILPSNDAFVGTGEALTLFDADGEFIGPRVVNFAGTDVLDAGTEVNTELDAAFLNQTAPDTGVDENGVVRLHDGFNGAAGNDSPEGDQNILGGTNAFGEFIDPIAADFTLPGAQIARVHINVAETTVGTSDADVIFGSAADDLVTAGGGADTVLGRRGYDEISGGAGGDNIFGGAGLDILMGNRGNDNVFGGRGNDYVSGNRGADLVSGGRGYDVVSGGRGDDTLKGGAEDDTFVFTSGDGTDLILDFKADGDADVLHLSVDGIDSFDDLLAVGSEGEGNTTFDFGDDGSVILSDVALADLTASDVYFF